MTNALDKRRTDELSATRRRVETALAKLPQPKNNQLMRAPAPEFVTLSCVCGVFDKPYALRFARQADGSLRFVGSVKGEPGAKQFAGAAVAVTVSMSEIGEDVPLPCAWCDSGGINYCRNDCGVRGCGALVCGGRTVGNVFHCRTSCGASWVGVPLENAQGETKAKPRSMQPAYAAPRVSVPERLLLTSGCSIARKGGKSR